MELLDDKQQIHAVDSGNMLGLLEDFSEQLRQAKQIGENLAVDPKLGAGVSQIVFSGMGGSGLAADLARALLCELVPLPMMMNRGYRIPQFVRKNTLFICVSYSGNTEESLECFEEALKCGARVLVVGSGGELAKRAIKRSVPTISVPQGFPPRMAVGFLSVPLLLFFKKLGLAAEALNSDDWLETMELVRSIGREQCGADIPFEKNSAKQLARRIFERYPVIYSGADGFDVVALRWRGQIEENAKTLASHHVLPEMNHHELAGWEVPVALLDRFTVLLLRDCGEHPQVARRMILTRQRIERKAEVCDVWSQGKSRLARMFSLIHLGDWVSFYLAILYGNDPTSIQVLDDLKASLTNGVGSNLKS